MQVLNRPNFRSRLIRLQGLDPEKIYRMEAVEGGTEMEALAGRSFGGDLLMKAGITVPNPWGDFQGRLIYLKAE